MWIEITFLVLSISIEGNKNNEIIAIKNIWHNAFRHIQQDENIDPNIIEKQIFPSITKEHAPKPIDNISAIQGTFESSLSTHYGLTLLSPYKFSNV